MPSTLETLRAIPQPTPATFVGWNPGCWIQYYDDTPAKNPAKALSARTFDPAVARRKQQEGCAVCYSLQVFGEARTKEGLLCFRSLGVDVDLVPADERRTLTTEDIDKRKDEYLRRVLLPFPLKPHWLTETQHGFHAVFRIQPLRAEADVCQALAVNRRLVAALRGDENAVLPTQVLRVPSTYQFKNPAHPFRCRLLIDNAGAVQPYDLQTVRSVLNAWQAFRGSHEAAARQSTASGANAGRAERRPDYLRGVPEGRRTVTAAALVGGILGRLPEYLWETAGWGGLKEWNGRNPVPLPERELRSVFESIARRERRKRQGLGAGMINSEQAGVSVHVRIECAPRPLPVGSQADDRSHKSTTSSPDSPSSSC